jgi:hypothetical protein
MNADGTGNAFGGQATHVVQAGTIYGGVNGVQNSLPVPRQLPRAATCFTDRADAMGRLSELATAENEVVLISGPAGVGKSALAVFWAHSVKQRFPDGQLYVNLRGYDRLAPLSPEEVLHGFLSALGAPVNRMPGDLNAMSALFRSLLDGKRLLLVADNAGSSDQVRPLLPSSSVCFTIVTSRNRLGSLTAVDGATHLPIRPLDTPEAVELFSRLSGHRDTDGATQLVLRCGRLPLTVRMAARQASSDASLTALLDELTGGGDRLEALSALDAMPLLELVKQFVVTPEERGRWAWHASLGGVVQSCATGGGDPVGDSGTGRRGAGEVPGPGQEARRAAGRVHGLLHACPGAVPAGLL